jgi:hypothetical protein
LKYVIFLRISAAGRVGLVQLVSICDDEFLLGSIPNKDIKTKSGRLKATSSKIKDPHAALFCESLGRDPKGHVRGASEYDLASPDGRAKAEEPVVIDVVCEA